jgi:iron complex outermembrane receptor protein
MKSRGFFLGALVAALWVSPRAVEAQTGTIRGKVTNEVSGLPLAGAAVWFGTRIAQTRPDGQYMLTGVPAGTGTLRARLIGYASAARTVTVVSGQTLDVDLTLAASAVNLSEIVVTGYGEQRAGNITGAVTQVAEADFNTGRIVSPELLIQAKVPGVQVVDNNEPGGGISLRVRGPTSINASSEPLYVIDGVPIGGGAGGGLSAGRNPLNFLNPSDIASITVLRDASAAAIYGANAANGVVLITTKAGKRGTSFEYTGSMSSSWVTRTPNMLNAEQFKAAVTTYAPTKVVQLQNANTNWFDQVTRTSFGQDHNLAASVPPTT